MHLTLLWFLMSLMKGLSKRTSVILIVLATILIMFFCFSFWLNKYIFDPQNFKRVTTDAILQEDSREAIASEVVDAALENNPLVKEVIGEKVESLVSNLLESNVSRTLFEEAALVIQKIITSPKREEIAIDTTVIKGFLEPLAEVVSPDDPDALKVEDVPDKIVLIQEGGVPSISTFGDIVFWVAPVTLIFSILIFAYVLYASVDRRWALRVSGYALIISSVIVSVLPYLFTPAIFASATNENMKIILTNIYFAFLSKFVLQHFFIIVVAVIMLVLGYGKMWEKLDSSKNNSKKA